jgi:hypothetical protein
MKTFSKLAASAPAVLASGCASMMLSDDDITARTAFAIGLNKGDFTITNRSNEGASARYTVRTKRGEDYNCFLGVAPGLAGVQVSEAICTKRGEPMRSSLVR